MNALRVRLRALLRRGTAEAELDEELRYHLEQDAARREARGAAPASARAEAAREFGNTSFLKEQMRDAWRLGWWDELRQDVRFGLRAFRSAPLFAATVAGTIALALGLNTTAFTVFNAYVLRPLAVRDPYSLFEVTRQMPARTAVDFGADDLDALRGLGVLDGAFGYRPLFAHRDGRPFLGALVTRDYFGVLGGTAALGRVLLPSDAAEGANVMVLSHRAWRLHFHADSAVLGRSVMIRDQALEIVGVASPRFDGISAVPPDFWAPAWLIPKLTHADSAGPTPSNRLRIVVRLAPGVSEAQAEAALTPWVRQATRDDPRTEAGEADAARPALVSAASMVPLSREILVVFVPVAVAFVLVMLIACANVANMMLARGIARQREIGIRLSLGAGRGRLVRQLLTEAVLLALPAAALGFVISRLTIHAALRAMFATIPAEFVPYLRIQPLMPDVRVFGFLLGVALLAAVLFGLAPALQATRADVVRVSRGDFDTGTRGGRLRGALAVAQVAVCLLLLVCTGVLLRGAAHAERARTETGLRTGDLVQVLLQDSGRAAIMARLRGDAQVLAIASTAESPIDGQLPGVTVTGGDARTSRAAYNAVSPEYFDVFGVALVQGRAFTAAEASGGSVAIVSAALAGQLWPGGKALGRTLRVESNRTARELVVVGVAANTVSGWIGTGRESPLVYVPAPLSARGSRLFVRVSGDPSAARAALWRELEAAAPGLVEEMHTASSILAVQLYIFQASWWLSAALGVIALLLTLAGIYGVLAYLVAQRRREIGIRLALGASGAAVVRQVMGQSARLAGAGIGIGLLLASAASLLFASQLYLIEAFDPLGYLLGTAVVVAACAAAAWVPTRRALAVDPALTLRSE